MVTSFAEVWIEILSLTIHILISTSSLPLRKCGLKSDTLQKRASLAKVTSFAEVWIEIEDKALEELERIVTSFAEVWIEIW